MAFADELANQGFTAITKPASAHIRLFILRDCCHQSEHHKSPTSSIGNLLMHAPDQFLSCTARVEGNSSLSYTRAHTCKPSLIYKTKHINSLVQTRIPFRDQAFDHKNQQGVISLAYVGKSGLEKRFMKEALLYHNNLISIYTEQQRCSVALQRLVNIPTQKYNCSREKSGILKPPPHRPPHTLLMLFICFYLG